MQHPITQNYISYQNTGKNTIFRADMHLIGGCNFKCVMCDNWKRPVELNFEHNDLLKAILTLKKDYNCNYIRFHGQEPTMYQKLEDLIQFSKKLGLKTAIKTNAWLLSDKRLIKTLKYGLDELYLSIDGPNAQIHDEIRGIKGSFDKNVDIVIKSRKINPNLKIYVNSVVMKSNFEELDKMIDFGNKYYLNRVSFVFLNDKNRKDIADLNLNKKEFFYFFKEKLPIIYEKSKLFKIPVDFSPFISDFVGKNPDYILDSLKNIDKYYNEINNFYEGIYGKVFYDKYGCFGPLDHCSINYNGDMFGCCVVERNRNVAVGNILDEDLSDIKHSQKYKSYRNNSNTKCAYASKCASNFYTRKTLFKYIYLDDNLYSKNEPINYYRYLKELYYEDENILNEIKLKKLKNLLLHFYNNLKFYRELLEKENIFENDILSIRDFSVLQKLPILDKKILQANIDEIQKLSAGKQVLTGKTSGNSGNRLEFAYPLDFKRYIKQIAIFSNETDFTYNDSYFSLTPINCNQTIVNSIKEPDYVKKIYITVGEFNYNKDEFKKINVIFEKNKHTKFIHGDSKYLLYLILGFKKYSLNLPKLKAVSLTYSYTNKNLKEYIKKELNCKVFDNYGCSEVGPISIDINGEKKIFGDNILLEKINKEFIVTDLDNDIFPFIRYKNGDVGEYNGKNIEIKGKTNQKIEGKDLLDLDNFFYENFRDILYYQFNDDIIFYISEKQIDENKLKTKLKEFLGYEFGLENLIEKDNFFELGSCSKFRTII